MFLQKLAAGLPSLSPTDNKWPEAPPRMNPLLMMLKTMMHDWRCNLYRATYDKSQQEVMREKLIASQVSFDPFSLFKHWRDYIIYWP